MQTRKNKDKKEKKNKIQYLRAAGVNREACKKGGISDLWAEIADKNIEVSC